VVSPEVASWTSLPVWAATSRKARHAGEYRAHLLGADRHDAFLKLAGMPAQLLQPFDELLKRTRRHVAKLFRDHRLGDDHLADEIDQPVHLVQVDPDRMATEAGASSAAARIGARTRSRRRRGRVLAGRLHGAAAIDGELAGRHIGHVFGEQTERLVLPAVGGAGGFDDIDLTVIHHEFEHIADRRLVGRTGQRDLPEQIEAFTLQLVERRHQIGVADDLRLA